MKIKYLSALLLFWTLFTLSGSERVTVVLFPFREAELASQVESVLKRCCFRVGEKFQQGAVLAELDDAPFALQVRRMQNQERFARAVLADKKELLAGKFTSDFEVKKAEFEWQSAKTMLDEALLKLSYCRIKAPFPGKIVEIMTNDHESVKSGAPLLKIIDDSQLLAVMNIPLGKTKPTGSTVRIRLEDNVAVTGKVYEVSPQANHRTGTLRIRVLIDNRRGKLRAGMTGELVDGK